LHLRQIAFAIGLRISGTFITFSTCGSLVLSSLASASLTVGIFGTTVGSSALYTIRAVCLSSAAEEVPSPNSGTTTGSI
jgi:hypothetical protein